MTSNVVQSSENFICKLRWVLIKYLGGTLYTNIMTNLGNKCMEFTKNAKLGAQLDASSFEIPFSYHGRMNGVKIEMALTEVVVGKCFNR